MKKRIVSSIMCLAMLLSLLPVSAFAVDTAITKVESKTVGVEVSYTDGTATLSGALAAPEGSGTTGTVDLTVTYTDANGDEQTKDVTVTLNYTAASDPDPASWAVADASKSIEIVADSLSLKVDGTVTVKVPAEPAITKVESKTDGVEVSYADGTATLSGALAAPEGSGTTGTVDLTVTYTDVNEDEQTKDVTVTLNYTAASDPDPASWAVADASKSIEIVADSLSLKVGGTVNVKVPSEPAITKVASKTDGVEVSYTDGTATLSGALAAPEGSGTTGTVDLTVTYTDANEDEQTKDVTVTLNYTAASGPDPASWAVADASKSIEIVADSLSLKVDGTVTVKVPAEPAITKVESKTDGVEVSYADGTATLGGQLISPETGNEGTIALTVTYTDANGDEQTEDVTVTLTYTAAAGSTAASWTIPGNVTVVSSLDLKLAGTISVKTPVAPAIVSVASSPNSVTAALNAEKTSVTLGGKLAAPATDSTGTVTLTFTYTDRNGDEQEATANVTLTYTAADGSTPASWEISTTEVTVAGDLKCDVTGDVEAIAPVDPAITAVSSKTAGVTAELNADKDAVTLSGSLAAPKDGTTGTVVLAFTYTDRNSAEDTVEVNVSLTYKAAEGETPASWEITSGSVTVADGLTCGITGTIAIAAPSAEEYDITVTASVEDENGTVIGTVKADKDTAAAGEKVTVTVTPKDGYRVNGITVKQDGTDVDVTGENGTYTFIMPAGDVSVTADIQAIPPEVDAGVNVTPDVEGGTASAAITDENISDAIEEATKDLSSEEKENATLGTLTIDATVDDDTVESTKVTLPFTVVTTLSEKDVSNVMVKTNTGDVTLTKEAFNKIADAADGASAVKLVVEGSQTLTQIPEAVEDQVTAMQAYDISAVTVAADTTEAPINISALTNTGRITLTLNVTDTNLITDGAVQVVYVDNGVFSKIVKANAPVVNGKVTFTTSHLSTYAFVNQDADLGLEPDFTAYTITFDANSGSVTPASALTNEDGKLTALPSATRSGYTFNGWFTAATGGTEVTTDTIFNADTTIYAQWTENTGPGGGGGGGVSSNVTVDRATNGKVSVTPTAPSKGATVTISLTPDTGYAVGTVTVTDKDGKAVELTKVSDTQYTFVMPDGKVTVKATFTQIDTPATGFTDVPADAYYADAVKWAVEKGITNGLTATTFGPNNSCTRGQMVTFLWRAAGSPAATGTNSFSDVASGEYYYNAVLWAVEKGITNGTSATTFSPNATVNRGQTVTFLYRYAESPAATGTTSFTDVAADAFYADAVKWAVAEEITNGTSATTFSPASNCTRGQIVTFMYRQMAE